MTRFAMRKIPEQLEDRVAERMRAQINDALFQYTAQRNRS